MTLSIGSFFDLFDSDWFGSWRPWLQSTLQTLGILLLTVIIKIPLVRYILSKAFKYMFTAVKCQANDLPKTGMSEKKQGERPL